MTAPDPARLHQSIRQLEVDGGRVDVEQLLQKAAEAVRGEADGTTVPVPVEDLRAIAALLDLIRRQDAALTAVRELAYNSDDGTEYEHNDGCCGEAECPACWATDIRRALASPDTTQDGGA